MTLTRYRVRKPNEGWGSRGADLLRVRSNAAKRIRRLMPLLGKFEVDRQDGTGRHPIKRRGVDFQLNHWDGRNLFIVDRVKRNGERVHVAIVDAIKVPVAQLSSTSPDTEVVWALIKAAFPTVLFGGSYVWKEIAGSSSWSDHAWGTAVDATLPNGAGNDRIIEWLARMVRTGNVDFDYALGSRDGRVVKCYSNGIILPSTADSSHLWHTHVSVVDHGGAKPPRTGGVW